MARFTGKCDKHGKPIVYADNEDLGPLESRWLTHPSGQRIKVRLRRLVWDWIDYFDQHGNWPLSDLLVLTERIRGDVPFDEALEETTAMVIDSKRRLGTDF